ncbi:MAG: bacteriohemerythrin [Lachnospiraceae bacterium]|nr:bacteriohemerythrin [Lachnospiraceae bacterium]
MYTFTKDCLIGVPEIDEEHKKLFELITNIDTALKSNESPIASAMLLINELKQYAVSHFSHEEAYMERINDPELKRQKKEHAAFVKKINSYSYADVSDESAKAIILELLEYLSKWLMGHILGSDILIGQFHKVEKPAIPVFDDSFKTGIPLIDEEHKTLFDIIGKVHKTLQTELVHDKFDAIMDILDELKEYTSVHFADEENYMRKIGYEGLARQEILHQHFIDKLNELDLNDVDENQEAYLYDFLDFLQNWLINHILKVDKLIC